MKKNIFLLSFLLILVACEKEKIEITQNSSNLFLSIAPSSNDYDANINIIANDLGAAPVHPHQIQIDARFKNENDENIPINNFKIDDIIPELQGNNNTYLKYLRPNENHYTAIQTKFKEGESVLIEVSDNDFPDFILNAKLPELIETTAPTLYQELSKSGIDLGWIPHENNLKVGIMIRYNSVLSKEEGLPQQDLAVIKYADDIDGEYTFTESELAEFPENCWVTIYIGRAEQDIIIQNGKKILFNSLHYQLLSDFKLK